MRPTTLPAFQFLLHVQRLFLARRPTYCSYHTEQFMKHQKRLSPCLYLTPFTSGKRIAMTASHDELAFACLSGFNHQQKLPICLRRVYILTRLDGRLIGYGAALPRGALAFVASPFRTAKFAISRMSILWQCRRHSEHPTPTDRRGDSAQQCEDDISSSCEPQRVVLDRCCNTIIIQPTTVCQTLSNGTTVFT